MFVGKYFPKKTSIRHFNSLILLGNTAQYTNCSYSMFVFTLLGVLIGINFVLLYMTGFHVYIIIYLQVILTL